MADVEAVWAGWGDKAPSDPAAAAPRRDDLLFPNGLGGFSPDGREYVITTAPDHVTFRRPVAKQRTALSVVRRSGIAGNGIDRWLRWWIAV